MIFKRGFFLILLRVLLIVLFSIGAVYSYLETDLSLTPYMFSGLILITTLELTWRLQSQEREVLLIVEDNGCGIEDRLVKEIFVPFFTSKKKAQALVLPYPERWSLLIKAAFFTKEKVIIQFLQSNFRMYKRHTFTYKN